MLNTGNYLKGDIQLNNLKNNLKNNSIKLYKSSDQFNYLTIFKSNFLFIMFTDKVIETFTQLQSCNKLEIIIIIKKLKSF